MRMNLLATRIANAGFVSHYLAFLKCINELITLSSYFNTKYDAYDATAECNSFARIQFFYEIILLHPLSCNNLLKQYDIKYKNELFLVQKFLDFYIQNQQHK